jgi:serine/threonine protein kinase
MIGTETRPSPAVLSAGAQIKGYRIERLLGRGGMGLVYEATQTSLNRRVALKLLPADSAHDRVRQARFRREALMQAALDHPHIVDVYETGVGDSGLFIAMRLVRGETLKAKIGPCGMDAQLMLELLTPVADALDTAHACGLVHRDVKPQNILVARRTHAYLADFGLVRVFADGGLTEGGGILGTPAYLAPELVEGGEATPASDIYSFAAVLHQCLTGHQSACRGALSGDIAAVVERGLAAAPDQRPATATELMHDARRALQPPRRVLTAPPPSSPPAPPRRLRRRVLAGTCIALAAVALVSAALRAVSTADARMSVRLEPPSVTPMLASAFRAEYGHEAPAASAGNQPGLAIAANGTVSGGGAEPLPIVCVVRDATTQVPVGRERAIDMAPPDASTTFMAVCWVPAALQEGHRYEVIVRVWHPSKGQAPVTMTRATYADGY